MRICISLCKIQQNSLHLQKCPFDKIFHIPKILQLLLSEHFCSCWLFLFIKCWGKLKVFPLFSVCCMLFTQWYVFLISLFSRLHLSWDWLLWKYLSYARLTLLKIEYLERIADFPAFFLYMEWLVNTSCLCNWNIAKGKLYSFCHKEAEKSYWIVAQRVKGEQVAEKYTSVVAFAEHWQEKQTKS